MICWYEVIILSVFTIYQNISSFKSKLIDVLCWAMFNIQGWDSPSFIFQKIYTSFGFPRRGSADSVLSWCTGCNLILDWIRIEAQDRARGAGSQEICRWMVRSWSLVNPSRKNKVVGQKKDSPNFIIHSQNIWLTHSNENLC